MVATCAVVVHLRDMGGSHGITPTSLLWGQLCLHPANKPTSEIVPSFSARAVKQEAVLWLESFEWTSLGSNDQSRSVGRSE